MIASVTALPVVGGLLFGSSIMLANGSHRVAALRRAVLPAAAGGLVAFFAWCIFEPQSLWPLGISALAALALLHTSVRKAVSRVIPIDPAEPVHAVAACLVLLTVGELVAVFLAAPVPDAGQPLHLTDVLLNSLAELVVVAIGAGLWLRRSPRAVLARLGLDQWSWEGVAAGVFAAGIFAGLDQGGEWLTALMFPHLSQQLNSSNHLLYGALTASVLGVLVLAACAALGEETLFRGLLQPRFGIIFTAALFSLFHFQYGITPAILIIFALALGLGLLRRQYGLWAAIVCHFCFDAQAGFGSPGWLLAVVGLVGLALIYGRPLLRRHGGIKRSGHLTPPPL